MHQSWGVVMLAVGVIAGCVLGVAFRINYFASPGFLVFAVVALVVMYVYPRTLLVGLCFVAGMVLAFFRVAEELKGEDYIRQFYELQVVVTGTVAGDPETEEGMTKFKLTGLRFGEEGLAGETGADSAGADLTETGADLTETGAATKETAGSIYAAVRENTDLKRGDRVTLRGKLGAGFGTYAGYMYQPKVVKILKMEPGDVVVKVRDGFAERILTEIPETEAKLGVSYLLGMKAGLDKDLEEKLRVVGLTHIVVASGAHLAILVEVARKIFGRVSRFAGLLFSVLFVLFFMSMVGWTPSILRAGMMTIMTLIAWYTGRKIAPLRLMVLVAAMTLMLNPMLLLNLGWMLSFASWAGIMLISPALTRFFYGERKPGLVAGTVLTTLSATVMTLPVTLYYYGQVSLISVVANLLILPTLSTAMGLVFLTGVFAGLPLVGPVVGFLATKILAYHILVVGWFGEMEQFLITIEPYDGRVWGIYGVILVGMMGVWWWRKRQRGLLEKIE